VDGGVGRVGLRCGGGGAGGIPVVVVVRSLGEV